MFSVRPDFPHGKIAYVPAILMKAGETARGNALKGLSVKVADNFFLFDLSSVETDMKRNIQLLEERSWIDIPIAYSDREAGRGGEGDAGRTWSGGAGSVAAGV